MISSRARGSGAQDVIWMISLLLWRLQTSSGRPGDVLGAKSKHLHRFWYILINIMGMIARICRGPDTYSHDILARARLQRPGCKFDDSSLSLEAADVAWTPKGRTGSCN